MVFLHGYGQSGDDLQIVRENGPPKLSGEGKQFPFVLASPQCPTGFYWRGNVVIGLIDHLIENYSIDPNRVYLTGLSMGGMEHGKFPMNTQNDLPLLPLYVGVGYL